MEIERERLLNIASDDKDVRPKHTAQVLITRNVYTQDQYDATYADSNATKSTLMTCVKKKLKICSPNKICEIVLSYFPCVYFVRNYNIKKNIAWDLLSGITVSFMHLPMALGFGILATLRPVHGLYTTFFSVLVYMILGTSPHVSFGTNAVMALLTQTVVEREAGIFIDERSAANGTAPTEDEIMEVKTGAAMACCFIVGAILLTMGLLKLGFITTYLSTSFVGGFTTASAVHIATSQLPKVTGITLTNHAGAGKLIFTYIEIFSKIGDANVAAVIIGVICMAVLLFVKICINERFKSKMKMPVPIDLIVVVVVTIISHFAKFYDKFNVKVVGEIPSGFTVPDVPHFHNLVAFIMDAVVIAVMSFALSISMAKHCAVIHGIDIDDNQELVAYGASNLIGSFFHAFPAAAAPPRTMILSSLGAKTTLHAVPTVVFIVLVILVIGQLFVSLPMTVLCAMIIVSMKDLLLQYQNLPGIWRINKYDFAIWMTTNVVSVLADLKYGIIAGIGVSIFLVVVRDQCAKASIATVAENEDVLVNVKAFDGNAHVKVFRIPTNLYFATCERIKSELFKRVPSPIQKPRTIHADLHKAFNIDKNIEHNDTHKNGEISTAKPADNFENVVDEEHIVLVIDCLRVSYIDMAGLGVLVQIVKAYKGMGMDVYLTGLHQSVIETLTNGDFFKSFPRSDVYYDVFDVLEMLPKTSNM
ncbi:sulfate transporter-like isoform X3 [Dreissena polymorpha]|uniref:STAS domain-containing protein n=1 Tax=Dreissena polymorpha TaxID=45954 RepID=A0A9D4M5X5_DREPO|nr:sulfate transporter-like isoform X1 [Dreissena polymorpha]XP_052266301.1 sulfate transporter-like isoform X2 [Dreissena polymorpha]XP_052266302.1 sulfate transporter-like isoform X3 [Dreissena polymorpha]KAH3871477.1 hypothetical protein DPMN_034680 [Dreissena polymorpha]